MTVPALLSHRRQLRFGGKLEFVARVFSVFGTREKVIRKQVWIEVSVILALAILRCRSEKTSRASVEKCARPFEMVPQKLELARFLLCEMGVFSRSIDIVRF